MPREDLGMLSYSFVHTWRNIKMAYTTWCRGKENSFNPAFLPVENYLSVIA